MIIRLPWPDARLSPNRKNGKAWQSTSKLKTEQRTAANICTKAALHTSGDKTWEGNIPLSLVYLAPDKRHRDLDNLLASSKALLDGMAEALGVDDSRFKPILVDCVYAGGEGALMAAVGITIVSGVSL
jgi:crossover junction endodeoxyribonuclease RusA